MVFNSIEFAVFFVVISVTYFAIPFRWRWLLLLLGSYYFYMSWNPAYVLLIGLSTLIDYVAALMMNRSEARRVRIAWLCASLTGNLGMLFAFKYYNFFRDSWSAVATTAGFTDLPISDLLLPVGISFYTFQSLSYTIDVYRRQIKPEKHFGIFALYVSFFPQLVAGPIERASQLLPQFHLNHRFEYEKVVDGLRLMLWGLVKKIVIADRLSILVDTIYNDPQSHSGPAMVLATVFFAWQIYCDFSGYTDIARGVARVLGFELMQNFNSPYVGVSISDFWRRWHISLSTWFKEYVYIPLGGNKVTVPRWYANLAITFLISGLWHGASWTFVIWGGLHAVYLIGSQVLAKPRKSISEVIGLSNRPVLERCLQIVTTFALVNLGWIFFRANSVGDAIYILSHLTSGWGAAWEILKDDASRRAAIAAMGMTSHDFIVSLVLIGMLHLGQIIAASPSRLHWRIATQSFRQQPAWIRWGVYYAMILTIIHAGVFGQSSFIYFQF